MKKFVSISLWALALLVGMCLSACSFHEDVDASLCENYDGVFFEFSLKLPTESVTRAVPNGGESGDGTETAKNHENKIDNIMVFIFRSTDGFDADGSTTFLYKGYFESGSTECEWTTTADGVNILFQAFNYIPEENDRVIVVANTGNLTKVINTLDELRNRDNFLSWRTGVTIAENDKFIMSSAYNNGTDGLVHLSPHAGTHDDPYVSTMNIQRAAARIDFMYNSADNLSGSAPYTEFRYIVKDGANNLAVAHVQNIIPINLMQESSYLIKRVTSTDDITSAVKYGALETATSGVPTNYVIEPHTLLKQSSVSDATLNQWYGATRAKTVMNSPASYLTTATSVNKYMETSTAQTELSYFTHYTTLAYTNENTQSKEKNDPDFMTGLLLKAVYEPSAVYTDKNKTVYSPMSDYATGKTFWRYSPTKALMGEKDCLFFTTQEAAEGYKAEHPEDLAEITEYPNGVCYYTVWLRHANVEEDPHDTFPMEYGIVRNNIYRVGIDKITGPGAVLPAVYTPDHVYLRIYVRQWNKRVQETIRL